MRSAAASSGDDVGAAADPGAGQGGPAPGMLVAAGDKGEATAAFVTSLVTALASANVRARAGGPGETRPAPPPPPAASRASLEQAALVTAEVMPEGHRARNRPRRGRVPRERAPAWRRRRGSTVAERAATARVFVDADKAERRARAVPRRSWAPTSRAGWRAPCPPEPPAATGDLRAVTVDADVVEPAAIPELVKSLRGWARSRRRS